MANDGRAATPADLDLPEVPDEHGAADRAAGTPAPPASALIRHHRTRKGLGEGMRDGHRVVRSEFGGHAEKKRQARHAP